jgi:hypothetical protein
LTHHLGPIAGKIMGQNPSYRGQLVRFVGRESAAPPVTNANRAKTPMAKLANFNHARRRKAGRKTPMHRAHWREALRGWARILLRRPSGRGFLSAEAHGRRGRSAPVLENHLRAAPLARRSEFLPSLFAFPPYGGGCALVRTLPELTKTSLYGRLGVPTAAPNMARTVQIFTIGVAQAARAAQRD